MHKRYRVTLTPDERETLAALLNQGRTAARTVTHARILLKADQSDAGPAWTDEAIVAALEVSLSTVSRVRRLFIEGGVTAALQRAPSRYERPRKLDGHQEAQLIALACGPAPAGHARWTLRLLASGMVRLEYVDAISHEAVRQVLKKTNLSLG